jgi:hypothetical protein
VKRVLACCFVATFAGAAHADEDAARLATPASAAAVLTLRPVALLGALHRLGSGWEGEARRALSLPPIVNPFDPSIASSVGVDPLGPIYVSADLLRGQIHVRAAIPLSAPRLADAMVQSASGLINVKLAREGKTGWIGQDDAGRMLLVRLDGTLLIVDFVQARATAATKLAQLPRLIPLKPVRAFDATRGTAGSMGPSDAFALWVDLAAAGPLAMAHEEQAMMRALRSVAPEMHAKIEKRGRAELETCRPLFKSPGVMFDDLLFAISVRGPNRLATTLKLGGTQAALASLHVPAVRPGRTIAASDDEDVHVEVDNAGPVRASLHQPPVGVQTLPAACPGSIRTIVALRRWPAMLSADAAKPDVLLRVISALRGGAASIAASPSGAARETRFSPERIVAIAELDDAARGDLDRLLANGFTPASPLKTSGRSLTAYSPPQMPWATGEGPLVAVGVGETDIIAGFGWRERLHNTFEHLVPFKSSLDQSIAHAVLSARGLTDLARMVLDEDQRPLIDGLDNFEATLTLDEAALRLELDAALHKAAH